MTKQEVDVDVELRLQSCLRSVPFDKTHVGEFTTLEKRATWVCGLRCWWKLTWKVSGSGGLRDVDEPWHVGHHPSECLYQESVPSGVCKCVYGSERVWENVQQVTLHQLPCLVAVPASVTGIYAKGHVLVQHLLPHSWKVSLPTPTRSSIPLIACNRRWGCVRSPSWTRFFPSKRKCWNSIDRILSISEVAWLFMESEHFSSTRIMEWKITIGLQLLHELCCIIPVNWIRLKIASSCMLLAWSNWHDYWFSGPDIMTSLITKFLQLVLSNSGFFGWHSLPLIRWECC